MGINASLTYKKLSCKGKIHTEVSGNSRSVAECHVHVIWGTRLHLFYT